MKLWHVVAAIVFYELVLKPAPPGDGAMSSPSDWANPFADGSGLGFHPPVPPPPPPVLPRSYHPLSGPTL